MGRPAKRLNDLQRHCNITAPDGKSRGVGSDPRLDSPTNQNFRSAFSSRCTLDKPDLRPTFKQIWHYDGTRSVLQSAKNSKGQAVLEGVPYLRCVPDVKTQGHQEDHEGIGLPARTNQLRSRRGHVTHRTIVHNGLGVFTNDRSQYTTIQRDNHCRATDNIN